MVGQLQIAAADASLRLKGGAAGRRAGQTALNIIKRIRERRLKNQAIGKRLRMEIPRPCQKGKQQKVGSFHHVRGILNYCCSIENNSTFTGRWSNHKRTDTMQRLSSLPFSLDHHGL